MAKITKFDIGLLNKALEEGYSSDFEKIIACLKTKSQFPVSDFFIAADMLRQNGLEISISPIKEDK